MSLIQKNQQRWDNMHITPSRVDGLANVAKRLVNPAAKARYVQIEKTTGVPWFVVAVIHERESGQNFNCQLAQGDPLNRSSTHVPKGRGPFFNHPTDKPGEDAFYRSALDALIDCPPHASRNTDWSPGGTLTLLEEYNGLGYANRGMPSPYIWSGSDQYHSGKYIADGVYSSTAIDVQEGCAPLIRIMKQLDPTIVFGKPTVVTNILPTKETPPMLNWKTTLTGIMAVIASVSTMFVMGKFDVSMLSAALPGVLAGLGLIFAKDSTTHSTPVEVAKAGVESDLAGK